MRARLAFLFLAVVSPTATSAMADHPVYASKVGASDLARDCASTDTTPLAQTFCLGYAMGAFDILVTEGDVCTDAGFTTGQGVAVARKYLRDHPEEWNLHPSILMRRAFSQAFPCRE